MIPTTAMARWPTSRNSASGLRMHDEPHQLHDTSDGAAIRRPVAHLRWSLSPDRGRDHAWQWQLSEDGHDDQNTTKTAQQAAPVA